MLRMKNMKMMKIMKKGVSPLIATVLLIAFTVAVAGVISIWITGFASESTETVTNQTDIELYCSNGGVGVSDLRYCNSYLAGIIQNTGLVDLSGITAQVTFQNATPAQTIYLEQNGSATTNSSKMVLSPRQIASFNITIGGSNYHRIHIYTNCANVYDDVDSGYVTVTC